MDEDPPARAGSRYAPGVLVAGFGQFPGIDVDVDGQTEDLDGEAQDDDGGKRGPPRDDAPFSMLPRAGRVSRIRSRTAASM